MILALLFSLMPRRGPIRCEHGIPAHQCTASAADHATIRAVERTMPAQPSGRHSWGKP